jgi:hypothetical protein
MKHNFTALIYFLFLFNATSNVYARSVDAISLDLPNITKKGDSLDVHGSCGGVKVKISGIKESFSSDAFGFDGEDNNGVFIVRDKKPIIKLNSSDHNTVLCVPVGEFVGTEFRLVVGSVCSGSACTDAMDYVVFNPKLGKVVSPKTCDIDCASKLVKSKILEQSGLM